MTSFVVSGFVIVANYDYVKKREILQYLKRKRKFVSLVIVTMAKMACLVLECGEIFFILFYIFLISFFYVYLYLYLYNNNNK